MSTERHVPVTTRTMGRWVAVLLSIAMAGVLATPVSAISDDAPPPSDDPAAGRYVVVMEDVPNVTEFGKDGVAGSAAEARSAQLTASHEAAARAAGVSVIVRQPRNPEQSIKKSPSTTRPPSTASPPS